MSLVSPLPRARSGETRGDRPAWICLPAPHIQAAQSLCPTPPTGASRACLNTPPSPSHPGSPHLCPLPLTRRPPKAHEYYAPTEVAVRGHIPSYGFADGKVRLSETLSSPPSSPLCSPCVAPISWRVTDVQEAYLSPYVAHVSNPPIAAELTTAHKTMRKTYCLIRLDAATFSYVHARQPPPPGPLPHLPSTQVISDARFRLAAALREAGVQHSEAAMRAVQVSPYLAPI